jgi:multidrug resistance efflux pump
MNCRTILKCLLPASICLMTPAFGDGEPKGSKIAAAAPGRVEGSSDMISVGASITGTVERVEVRQGDRVKAGQPLVRILCDDQKARLAQRIADRQATDAYYRKLVNGARTEEREIAQDELTLSEARLAEAQARLNRSTALTQTNSVSVSVRDVDDRDARMARAQHEVALSRLALIHAGTREEELAEAKARDVAAGQAIDGAKAELDKCEVRSPVTGIVLRKNVSEGELVSLFYPKPVMVISETEGYRIRAEVDENDVPNIKIGQSADVIVFTKNQLRLRGRVSRIAPVMGRRQILTSDPADKSDRDVVEVLIALEDKPDHVPIGLRVSVLFFE